MGCSWRPPRQPSNTNYQTQAERRDLLRSARPVDCLCRRSRARLCVAKLAIDLESGPCLVPPALGGLVRHLAARFFSSLRAPPVQWRFRERAKVVCEMKQKVATLRMVSVRRRRQVEPAFRSQCKHSHTNHERQIMAWRLTAQISIAGPGAAIRLDGGAHLHPADGP